MPDAARIAYIFQCQGEDLYAVSHDITGANIPRSSCSQGWHFCEEFELGSRAQVPGPIMAEPVLKGITDNGYYVWRGWSGSSKRPPTNVRCRNSTDPSLALTTANLQQPVIKEYDDFCECLRLLAGLQRQELIHLRAFAADDHRAWVDFKRDPLRWLLRADDHRAAAVWGAIERGRKGLPPTNFVEDYEPSSQLNVIEFIPKNSSDP